MTEVDRISLNLIGGGVGGHILVDYHSLCTGELIEEVSKSVSLEVELCKIGGDINCRYCERRGERLVWILECKLYLGRGRELSSDKRGVIIGG